MAKISAADRARLHLLARQTNRRALVALIPATLVLGLLITTLPAGASGLVVAGSGLVGVGLALACGAPFRSFKAKLGLSSAEVREIIAGEKAKAKAAQGRRTRADS